MELLVECTDSVARAQVASLFKYVLNRLKVLEKEVLFETTSEPIQSDKTETIKNEVPIALCSRFI